MLLALVASILYTRWLPALLVFGIIINSLVGLVTHHAPTNPRVAVSAGVAWMLTAFYSVGCVVSRYYDATRLSVVDRVALLVYLFCMIWPALVSNDLAVVNPTVASSVSVGMATLIVSFAAHRRRGAKSS